MYPIEKIFALCQFWNRLYNDLFITFLFEVEVNKNHINRINYLSVLVYELRPIFPESTMIKKVENREHWNKDLFDI